MAIRRIYVASSWRNEYYPEVVIRLRNEGFGGYDFRNPLSGDYGFWWDSIDSQYMIGRLKSIRRCYASQDFEAV